MSQNDNAGKTEGRSTGASKLWGYVLMVAVVVVLSRVGLPASFLKNFLPIVARQGMANSCDECGGDGTTEAACRECFGRGYFRGANCAKCDKTGKVKEVCRFCGGSGAKPKP